MIKAMDMPIEELMKYGRIDPGNADRNILHDRPRAENVACSKRRQRICTAR